MIIKCPNCGSTAQVEITKQYWSHMSQSEWTHCYCRCGCVFHFEKMLDGTINGSWQVYKGATK